MNVFWEYLIPGLLFAWLPPRLMMKDDCRYLNYEQLQILAFSKTRRRRRWWKQPLLWIDPVRGYVAASLLLRAFTVDPDAKGAAVHGVTLCVLMALGIAMLVQTSGRRGEREVIAPFGFLAGLMVALLHPVTSTAAIILGAASVAAFHAWSAGLVIGTLATVAVGVIFMGKSVLLAGTTGLVISPLALSWLLNRKLVFPVRI